MIELTDFEKIEIKIGTVTEAEKVERSEKLIKLTIDFGSEQRTIVTAMAQYYEPEHFTGKQMPFIMNLKPRKFLGIESQGMIMAADIDGKPILIHLEKEVPNGTMIR